MDIENYGNYIGRCMACTGYSAALLILLKW